MAEKLIHFPEDVHRVLTLMEAHKAPKTIQGFDLICREADQLRLGLLNNVNRSSEDWKTRFLLIGHAALSIVIEWNAFAFAELLLKKHTLYGIKPLLLWRELGVCVRLTNKIERMKNMMADPSADTQGESWNDTLSDIVGYCVLGWWLKEKGY